MAVCSFGKVVLNDVFQPRYPFGTDLEGRFLYLEDHGQKWLLAAFDFSGTFRSTALAWREAISGETGIPVSCIWYHELQIHAAPISYELAGEPCDKLIELCVPEIKAMMLRAEEADIDTILTDFPGFNMNREQYIPELGTVTVWAGLGFDSLGRPWSQNPAIMNLDGYRPALPAFEQPIYFDRPTDSQGLLAVFRAKNGKVLGTLTRFAGHPDVAVLFESHGISDQYRYHFDWTGYLRQTIDQRLGGTGLYLNGPCANLSVRKGFEGMTTYEACDREAMRIGHQIAEAFLQAWKNHRPCWDAVRMTGLASGTLSLSMRASLPENLASSRNRDAWIEKADTELASAVADKASPAKIKRLIDEKFHQRVLYSIVNEWVGFTDRELKERQAAVEAEAIALNGLVFLGLPGESLTETSIWLKAMSLGDRLITLDQVNGYIGYVTTAEAYDHGGYACWGGWVERDADNLLRKKALDIIQTLI